MGEVSGKAWLEEAMGRIENHDAKAWRARAEECRAIADTFENPETRAKMYLVADDYERMAERADGREQKTAGEEAGMHEGSRSGATETRP